MSKKTLTYPSANGEHNIFANVWTPDDKKEVRGVLQISHGMSEHSGRYADFARFMASRGFVVCANDHAGHGKSVREYFGYFGKKGYEAVVKDMHTLTQLMKAEYPNKPYFLLGHSMGSFLSRAYCAKHGQELTGILYSGTGVYTPVMGLALAVTRAFIAMRGETAENKFINTINNKMFTSRFAPVKTGREWLSRDTALIEKHAADPVCFFIFTNGGYRDLFMLIRDVSTDGWYRSVPKNLPMYIFSGDADPVGEYGKAVKIFYEKLNKSGCGDVTLKLYKDGRHEMLNEINRKDVYADILTWIKTKGC